MKLKLFHRHYGVHSLQKEIKIKPKFTDVVKFPDDPNADFAIDERAILDNMPAGFLPVKPDKVLLTVGDKYGSTAQRHPINFRHWGKYFDSYSLELCK
jgi:hypothetical protein